MSAERRRGMELKKNLKKGLSAYSQVSTHALAAWRIALGLVVFFYVIYLGREVDVFYHPVGVYPYGTENPVWSPLSHMNAWQVNAVFILTGVTSLFYAAGVRGVKFLLPLLYASIHQRAPALATGGDAVMMLALVYAALLPVEYDWSVESRLRTGRFNNPASRYESWAYPLVLLQLAVNYSFNTINKFTDPWESGIAIERAFGNPTTATPTGALLHQAPDWFLGASTYGTLVLEGMLPFLLLSPIYRRQTHRVAGALMIGLHGMIVLTLEVGFFGWAMLAQSAILLFRPPPDEFEQQPLLPVKDWHQIVQRTAVLLLVYSMAWSLGRKTNIAGINRGKLKQEGNIIPMPTYLVYVHYWLNLHQGWGMFAVPLDRSYVNVTHAETKDGRVFDPWRYRANDELEALTHLPRSGYKRHMYFSWETRFMTGKKYTAAFGDWVLQQGPHDDPENKAVRFGSWTLSVPSEKKHQQPLAVIKKIAGAYPLPLRGALPVKLSGFGVWEKQRTVDGQIVEEGSHVMNPLGSAWAPGCSHLILELKKPAHLKAIYVQADARDVLLLEGSTDGDHYAPLAKVERLEARQYRSRLLEVDAKDIQYVRIRPENPRYRRGFVSEVALFDEPKTLPSLRGQETKHFAANYQLPAAMGVAAGVAGNNKCSWD